MSAEQKNQQAGGSKAGGGERLPLDDLAAWLARDLERSAVSPDAARRAGELLASDPAARALAIRARHGEQLLTALAQSAGKCKLELRARLAERVPGIAAPGAADWEALGLRGGPTLQEPEKSSLRSS